MSYQDTYETWLNSPALSAQEKAELESIRTDEKEKESRFFDQLSFGTAGLRGVMGVGDPGGGSPGRPAGRGHLL